MAKKFSRIESVHRDFIQRQRIFFTGSAAADGRVNVSPKGLDTLRILSDNCIAYLDLTGSGNETAAHLRLNDRLTVMFCALDGPPSILRLYGKGRVLARGVPEYADLIVRHFSGKELPGARQIVVLEIDLLQTSCGFGVPTFQYVGDRPVLTQWAESKGIEGLAAYRREKNAKSIDGFPTGLIEP
jgi:predicted pyridoxine 5'-phosphate oxidase superfamily flavin-nucleotide-binding protein